MKVENIKIIDGINDNNKSDIVKCTNEKGKGFLEQWAGKSLDFPLTESQIDDLKDIYSIFCENEFVGIIQKIRKEHDNIHIGRFLINPELTGKGLGKRALIEFINLIFQDEDVNSITLNVFDYNAGAKKLYEKVGFEVVNVTENPMKKYMMIMKKGEK
ncbi:GNAT family N-acetyltransferase [uncultured Leptotrichia sp.]|uniref:GNAT family N-acetyltransferase n=1 Tax=uncultured Leptotrichia sp. TaxID=159271 RepID=UPI00263882C5|nr:GNAT family N-acetyltransferase [uncultured Leptotrichia sp.]